MWTDIADFFGASRYAQHSICLTNDYPLMFLYVLSDGATFLAYMTIGLSLLMIDRMPTELRPPVRYLFGAFVALCGLSHFTMILTLFVGVYRLDILVRAMMGSVSVVTAVVIINDLLQARRGQPR